jgi:class 3 adenylate cyclase/tetratricopeptide (TPR) repeat protein
LRRERKVVTVLFADLVGFTARSESLDPEDVEAILRPYHERLRTELEQRGGTVEKFVGDAVMAVFGAPVAHEDDPERAVRASLAIRDGIVEDGKLEVRIAVNTGEALVNVDARPEAGEAMVAGDVVNTASRLQSAAPSNGILVGEPTYRATQHMIDYREHDAVDAKGKAEPVRVWEVVQARARVGVELRAPSTPLVGRARERELLLGAFERVRSDPSTQLFTVVGVPGIGKSRLVAELFGELDREAEITQWRQGRSLPYGEGGAFWAFAEMVKAEAGILDTDAAADAERKLREAVAAVVPQEDSAWVEARLGPLVGLDAAGGARDESFASWRRFVEALAERRPTVLVFEDLHWADDDLLDFVDELPDWIEDVPLLIVVTARPELLDRRPGWGGGKRNALTLSLAPLADDDTARLLTQLLDQSVLPAETQQALLARAGGNPLYAEQFARMFSERGEAAAELPETVQGIIAARIDSLPREEKSLLLDAAVLGKTFWAGALGIDGADARLHALQRKEFVRRERRSSVAGETEFAFTHLLVCDVAYGQIPRADRADKHVRAARWIESLAGDRSEDLAELLAHHYVGALDLMRASGGDVAAFVEPAAAALVDAAERAASLSAFSQAERFAARALELAAEEGVPWARAQYWLALAEHNLGKGSPEARAAKAATAFRTAGDIEAAADAEMLSAICFWQRGLGEEADRASERGLALVRDAPASRSQGSALVERSRLLMLRGRFRDAVELGREGLAIAEELGLVRLQISALVNVGTALNGLGVGGVGELERAIELGHGGVAPGETQRAYNNLAEEMIARGQLRDAFRLYGEGMAEVERFGIAIGVQWLLAQEAAVAYYLGDWNRAIELIEDYLKSIAEAAGHYLEGQAMQIQALIVVARGDGAAALAYAQRALEHSRNVKDPQALGPALATLASILVAEGRAAEAVPLVDELLTFTDENGEALYYTWAIDLGWLIHDLGRPETPPPSPRAPVWTHVGNAVARGDFVGAVELLEATDLVTATAYARLRTAELLASQLRHAEARPYLEPALAFYRSVGASSYVLRGEALLRASA